MTLFNTKSIQLWVWGVFLLTVLAIPAQAQQDCEEEFNYSVERAEAGGGSSFSFSRDYRVNVIVGQPIIGVTGFELEGNLATYGQLGYYDHEPTGPFTTASEGEYLDRIEVKWEVINDRLAAPVTDPLTRIYRNGSLMATVPLSQTSYQDFNVFPGEYYVYEIVTANEYGESHAQQVIGFLNPNGRITGNVSTRSEVPVSDVKITLSPNLGRTLEFDGVDDYVFFTDEVVQFDSTYTIEGWYRNLEAREQTIFSALDSATTTPIVKIVVTEDGRLQYYHDGNGDGTATILTSKDAYNTDNFNRKWHHFAAVYGAESMYLYVDGQRVAETDNPSDNVATICQIELGKDGKDIFSGYFQGHLDEFRVWNLERSREQLRKYDDITLTGAEPGLQHYWKFDERFGDEVYDYTVYANVEDRVHGYSCDVQRTEFLSPVEAGAYTDEGGDYIVSGVYYGSGTTFQVNAQKSTSIGFSLDFDGQDDFLGFQNERLPLGDEFTIEGWFKVGDHPANDMVLFETTHAETNDLVTQLKMNASGNIVATYGSSGATQEMQTPLTYDDEFWYHVAFVNDGAGLKLYIDGQEIASQSGGFASVGSAQLNRFTFGRSNPNVNQNGSSYFDGRLDEFRVFGRAKTENEINATLNQVLPLDELGVAQQEDLIGYWAFVNGRGIIINDQSPNQLNGIFQNPQTIATASDPIITNWDGDDIPLDVEFFNHAFQPNARNVSLDPSVTAVDRVDFTDISKLSVSGFVRFEGTNCFADSVEVFVNGTPTLPGTFTDKSGKFSVEFEPGTTGAILTYAKEDHTFTPALVQLPRLVRPIAGLSVTNNTKRKLMGSVVGGNCNLPIAVANEARVIISTQPFCYGDTAYVDASGKFEFSSLPPQKYVVYVEHPDPTIQTYFDELGAREVSLLKEDKSVDFKYRAPLQMELAAKDPEACLGEIVFAQTQREDVGITIFEEYLGERCLVSAGNLTINDDIADLPDPVEAEFSNGYYSYSTRPGQPNVLSSGTHPFGKRLAVFAEDDLGRSVTDELWVIVTGEKPRESNFTTTAPEIPSLILRAPPGDQSYAWIEEGTTIKNSLQLDVSLDDETQKFGKAKLGAKVVTQSGAPGLTVETEAKTDKYKSTNWTTGSTVSSSFEVEREMTFTERIETKPNEGDVYVGGAMNILYGKTDIISYNTSTCSIDKTEDIAFYPDDFATTFAYSENFLINSLIPELEMLGKIDDANMWKKVILMNHALKTRATFVENVSFDAGIGLQREKTTSISGRMTYEMNTFIEPEFVLGAGLELNGNGTGFGKNHKMRLSHGQSEVSTEENSRTIGYFLSDDDFGDNFTVNIKEDPIYGTPVFELVSGASSCPFEGEAIEFPGDLSGLSIEPQIQDLGLDMAWEPASHVLNGSKIGTIKNVVKGIEEVVGLVGIDLGISDAIDEATDLSFLDDKISEYYELKTGHSNPAGTIMDFYIASFDERFKVAKGVKREGVQLTVDRNIATNVAEDRSAIFELSLGNISETDEPAVYYLTALQESNPDGAVLRVNGQPLTGNQDLAFTLQPGQQQKVTLEVEKGPVAFEYNDLELMLFSSCEKERAEALGFNIPEEPFASLVKISARFVEVCTPVSIFDPGDEFVITQVNENTMPVTLTDYVVDREDFTEIKFQYREKIEGQPWINAVETVKADLDPVSTIINWDVTDLDDGRYEIRALTFCDAVPNPRSSEVLTGTIDRAAPVVFGTPSPADGVLGMNDEISITFNEDIQCGDIISLPIDVSLVQGEANNVAVSNTETGLYMDAIVTCEGNKLIIVPDIQNKFIEGQVIRVDVLGMSDELGNQQREQITWEFRVQRNPLAWQGGDIQSVYYEGERPQFTRQLRNNGAFAVNVNLSGVLDVQTLDETPLPSWVTASPRSFTLQPGATQDVTFTISDQISGGEYQDVVAAATSFGAPVLRFDLRVLCAEPAWAVNESAFEFSTTLTGQLDIRGELSEDEYDMVAAFVDDELRGVGTVSYAPELAAIPGEHPYLVFMTIYSNSTSPEQVEFRVWDASRCQLYGEVAERYMVGASSVSIGSPTNPATITVTDNLVQNIALKKGWNWISFNLNATSSEINNMLGSLKNADRGAIIKSQNRYSQYVPSLGWVGPLARLDSTKAYRVKLTADDVLEVRGTPVDFETTTIQLDSGWNWVSFLPPVGMEINEALTSLAATSDFIIKGQKEFAQYVDFQGWVGSLDFLRPNRGYQVYSDRKQTLSYPVTNVNARQDIPDEQETNLPAGWMLNAENYEYNTNFIIKVEGMDIQSGDILGLFENGELKGVAEAQYLPFIDGYLFFATSYSNSEAGTLEARLARGGEEVIFGGQEIMFESEQVFGTVTDPIVLETSAVLGVESLENTFDIYPNPGRTHTMLRIQMITTGDVLVKVQSLTGQTLQEIPMSRLAAGEHTLRIDRSTGMSAGIYLIRVEIGEETLTKKLIWK